MLGSLKRTCPWLQFRQDICVLFTQMQEAKQDIHLDRGDTAVR